MPNKVAKTGDTEYSIKRRGQHVLITGGSSGIGKSIALLFVGQGAHVSIFARTASRLEEARRELEAARIFPEQRIASFAVDVSQHVQITTTIGTAIEQLGAPEVLVTSAGIAQPGYFDELPTEVFEQTMAINYFGTLYCIQAVLPFMKRQRRGHIALVSSGAGLIGVFGYTPYSPTKFALRGLAESLRGEMQRYGIHVSIAYPPDTDTPQLAQENKTKPWETKIITGTAKMWGAEDVARIIVRDIERKRFTITPGLEMTLLSRLHSLLLPSLNRYFAYSISRARRSKEPSKDE